MQTAPPPSEFHAYPLMFLQLGTTNKTSNQSLTGLDMNCDKCQVLQLCQCDRRPASNCANSLKRRLTLQEYLRTVNNENDQSCPRVRMQWESATKAPTCFCFAQIWIHTREQSGETFTANGMTPGSTRRVLLTEARFKKLYSN